MARPIWSGAVSFGIVSIPVQLFSAVHEHDIHFHQISRQDHRRIHYRKVVEGKDAEVGQDDIVKGYEVQDGRYVVFNDEELGRIAARKSTTIAIESFVPLAEIDPRYFESLYYLFPGKQGEKPYQLLLQALQKADLVGVSRLVMHGKEHLVIVRGFPEVIGVQTLRFADEITRPDTVHPLPHAKVTTQELALAGQLIASMTAPFKPADFKDEYLGRLRIAIARKSRGQTIEVLEDSKTSQDEGKVLDLMAALDRSLRAKGGPGGSKPSRPDAHPHRRRSSAGAERRSTPAHPHHGKRAS